MLFKSINLSVFRKCLAGKRLAMLTRTCHNQSQKISEIPAESQPEPVIDETYDIVINGGGIVGFSMLAAIKSSPFLSRRRVLLIEQQSPPKSPVDTQENSPRLFSNRVSAITLSSREFFQQLGVWNSLNEFAKRVLGMYVWSAHYQNGVNFHRDDSDECMCYILENNRMMKSLHERIEENSNTNQKISYKTSVVDIHQDVDVPNRSSAINLKLVDIDDPEQRHRSIQTRLLIGCDGFRSITRAKSTLPYFELDLEQMGIVGTLQVESSYLHNEIAFQRFVDDKLVIALLPLDEQHSSLVLSVPKKDVADWMKLSDQDFISKLNQELIREPKIQNPLDKLASTFNLSNMYGNVQVRSPPTIRSVMPGSRASFPLGFGTTVPFLVGTIQAKVPLLQALVNKEKRANTAIIGDAAHRVHPLAGQGLNLGLGDASVLASSLESKLAAGYELFAPTPDSEEALSQALYDFERQRVVKLVPMLGAIHSMQLLFSWTPSALLPVFNTLELPKKLIVSFANSR